MVGMNRQRNKKTNRPLSKHVLREKRNLVIQVPLNAFSSVFYKKQYACFSDNQFCCLYQAYAVGASPPGPGNISSSFLRTSSPSCMLAALTALSSCSMVRGPMIGAVTTGL